MENTQLMFQVSRQEPTKHGLLLGSMQRQSLGDPDYVWFWFSVSEDFNTIQYTNRTENTPVEFQTLTQYLNKTMNQICAIVVSSDTNVFNHSTVSTTGNKGIGVYSNVFQCNPRRGMSASSSQESNLRHNVCCLIKTR